MRQAGRSAGASNPRRPLWRPGAGRGESVSRSGRFLTSNEIKDLQNRNLPFVRKSTWSHPMSLQSRPQPPRPRPPCGARAARERLPISDPMEAVERRAGRAGQVRPTGWSPARDAIAAEALAGSSRGQCAAGMACGPAAAPAPHGGNGERGAVEARPRVRAGAVGRSGRPGSRVSRAGHWSGRRGMTTNARLFPVRRHSRQKPNSVEIAELIINRILEIGIGKSNCVIEIEAQLCSFSVHNLARNPACSGPCFQA